MRILITGGAGFIGSALCRYLIQHTSHTVINLDALTYAGNLLALKSVAESPRYHFYHGNITDQDLLQQIFSRHQPDAVMHLAAESHVDRSIASADAFIQTNIVGTFHLLEATRAYLDLCDAHKRSQFRFHHISTDEVYGDLPHPNDADYAQQLFSETTSYAPSSPYSASKASSDHLVRAWHRTYDLPILLTNCSNNYGPFHHSEKLIPQVILNALSHQPIPVYGPGHQIRDWLYVDDHVAALYTVLTKGEVGQAYNIGGHNEIANIDLIHLLCEQLKKVTQDDFDYCQLITHIHDRPGHDRRYAIDASKIANTLGWRPSVTLEQGLAQTVDWFLANLALYSQEFPNLKK